LLQQPSCQSEKTARTGVDAPLLPRD